MRQVKSLPLSKYQQLFAILFAMTAMFSTANDAHALTGGDVFNKMSSDERNGYIAGIVSGLGQARWIADRPDQTGSACIANWLYGEQKRLKTIEAWFRRHPDKPAASLLYVLIKKECGE